MHSGLWVRFDLAVEISIGNRLPYDRVSTVLNPKTRLIRAGELIQTLSKLTRREKIMGEYTPLQQTGCDSGETKFYQ